MSIRKVTTPTAIEQNSVAIYAAIEMSGSNGDVVVHTPASSKLSRYRVRAGDTAQLLELIERVAAKVARQAEQAVSVVSCYEAGYDGFWLHRVLSAQGLTNHVIDAASLQVDRRARRAKTDRLDGEALVLALMAWYRGEQKACRMVRVPSPAEEDAKRGHREREHLIKERVQHVNRIKGLLAIQGIVGFHPLHRQRRARLAALSLPPHLQAEIERELVRFELLLEQIAALEAERAALFAAAPAADDPVADKIRALARLKGPDRRQRARPQGLLPQLPQPARGRQLCRADADAVAQRQAGASRASVRPEMPACAPPSSSSPGRGCATSPTARSPAGSAITPAARPAASGASPSSPWRASSPSRFGAMSRPESCRPAPC